MAEWTSIHRRRFLERRSGGNDANQTASQGPSFSISSSMLGYPALSGCNRKLRIEFGEKSAAYPLVC